MERTCPKTSLTVGDVARRSGIAISTVHFYEAKGLIAGWRTIGNQRRYHRAVLRHIAIIRIAQPAGLQLGEIAMRFRRIAFLTSRTGGVVGGVSRACSLKTKGTFRQRLP